VVGGSYGGTVHVFGPLVSLTSLLRCHAYHEMITWFLIGFLRSDNQAWFGESLVLGGAMHFKRVTAEYGGVGLSFFFIKYMPSVGQRANVLSKLAASTFYFFLAVTPRPGSLLQAHVGCRKVGITRVYGHGNISSTIQLGFLFHR
jgi:hypothetical protein